MARPPQYERSVDTTRDVTAVNVAIKHLAADDRAHLIAWLLLYYDDAGAMFSSQAGRRRRRVTIDEIDYWLVRFPDPSPRLQR
jgi:hypothetical protein